MKINRDDSKTRKVNPQVKTNVISRQRSKKYKFKNARYKNRNNKVSYILVI